MAPAAAGTRAPSACQRCRSWARSATAEPSRSTSRRSPQERERLAVAAHQDVLPVVHAFAGRRVDEGTRAPAGCGRASTTMTRAPRSASDVGRREPRYPAADDDDVGRGCRHITTGHRREPRGAGNHHLAPARHPNGVAEDVVAARFDPLQEVEVDRAHDAGGREAPGVLTRQFLRRPEEWSRARFDSKSSSARIGPVIRPARRSASVTPKRSRSSVGRYRRPASRSRPRSRRMLVNWSAMPRSTAYWRQRGSVYSKIRCTRGPRRTHAQAVSAQLVEGAEARPSRSISTPSITSSSGCLGSLKASMWGARAAPCGVRGCRPSKHAASSSRQPAIDAAAASLDASVPSCPARSSTSSSTARQKSHTAMMARRLCSGSPRTSNRNSCRGGPCDAQAGCGRPQATAPREGPGRRRSHQGGPRREDVEPGLLEAVQDAHTAEPGQSQFVPEAPALVRRRRRGLRRTAVAFEPPFPRARPARRPR